MFSADVTVEADLAVAISTGACQLIPSRRCRVPCKQARAAIRVYLAFPHQLVFFRAVFRKSNIETLKRHLRGGSCLRGVVIARLKRGRNLGSVLVFKIQRIRHSAHYSLEPTLRSRGSTLGKRGLHVPTGRIISDSGQGHAPLSLVRISATALRDVATGEGNPLGNLSPKDILCLNMKLMLSFQKARSDKLACLHFFTIEFISGLTANQSVI